MFHLSAYQGNISTIALQQINALTDNSMNVQSNNFVIDPRLPTVIGAYALGNTIVRAQFQAPSLRQKYYPDIAPVDQALLPTTPSRFVDYRFTPFQLVPNEQLSAFIGGSAVSTAHYFGVWFADGAVAPVGGNVSTLRFTGTTTLTANVWTTVPLTLDQTLPAGRYQLVGARMFGVSPVLFRFVVPGYPWRPGGIALATNAGVEHPSFRVGGFGVWCEFTNVMLPQMEVLATAADTVQTGFLDLLYLGQ